MRKQTNSFSGTGHHEIPQQKGERKSYAVREVRKTGMLIREALAVAYGMYRALVVSAWPGNLKRSELTDRMERVGSSPAPSLVAA